MHATMIRAIMTAYSTAVGPSSRFRKAPTHRPSFAMSHPLRRRLAASGFFRSRRAGGVFPGNRAAVRRLGRGASVKPSLGSERESVKAASEILVAALAWKPVSRHPPIVDREPRDVRVILHVMRH